MPRRFAITGVVFSLAFDVVLCLGLGAILATVAVPIASAQVSDDVVKIGVLTDMSGPASDATGPGSVAAAQMAIEDFGGQVLGKPIELVSANHQDKPDIGATIARTWYDVDKVDLILDVPVSAVGLAVQAVSREKQKLLIVHGTGTADFTGKFCTPYSMQWVFNTFALATGTAREVVKRGGDSWFFLTADYVFGHALEHDVAAVVLENGGKVLGKARFPWPATSSPASTGAGSTPRTVSFMFRA